MVELQELTEDDRKEMIGMLYINGKSIELKVDISADCPKCGNNMDLNIDGMCADSGHSYSCISCKEIYPVLVNGLGSISDGYIDH